MVNAWLGVGELRFDMIDYCVFFDWGRWLPKMNF